jgi:hypothetical protein
MASAAFQKSLVTGRARFEKGDDFGAHEAWEAGWKVTQGDEKRVLQALILWAAARHQHGQGKLEGAEALLTKAMERAGAVDEGFDGLDVKWLNDALLTEWERREHRPAPVRFPEVTPKALVHEVALEHPARCPACGEAVLVAVAPEDAGGAEYVEDCPVCCRPWRVEVRVDGGDVRVTLSRS